jgi:hypothetical protein
VGLTGLFWLFLSYGFVLYQASDLISEGSELLLLVPSMAGLVGGVVLPLLGAVPDGAIILFSGLGEKEAAQETLSVGVGALAGSTIMLLTLPFALSVYGGRVDILPDGQTNYFGKPKLSAKTFVDDLTQSGVTISEAVRHGGIFMALTTLPYFLIQGPAMFLHGKQEDVAAGEHWWSLSGLVLCLVGLAFYMKAQLQMSRAGEDRDKRMAVMKKVLKMGKMSLSGIAKSVVQNESQLDGSAASQYQSLGADADHKYPPPAVAQYLKELLADAFRTYDHSGDGSLDKNETQVFFRDFHETISDEEVRASSTYMTSSGADANTIVFCFACCYCTNRWMIFSPSMIPIILVTFPWTSLSVSRTL